MGLRLALVAAVLGLVACAHTGTEIGVHHLRSGGVGRTWYEFRPARLPDRPPPLLVLLHGYQGRALDTLVPTGVADEARRDGFVVAVPDSVGPGWNAGSCCGDSTANDVGFVGQVVSSLISERSVDAGRIYLAGFSNGGMLAYLIGCRLTGILAGVAVIEGTMTAPCSAHPPVDLLVFHQLGDTVVPYAGTATSKPALLVREPFRSVPAALAAWEQAEGCAAPPVVATPPRAVATCPSGARVELDVLPGGAHEWPPQATTELATFFRLRP